MRGPFKWKQTSFQIICNDLSSDSILTLNFFITKSYLTWNEKRKTITFSLDKTWILEFSPILLNTFFNKKLHIYSYWNKNKVIETYHHESKIKYQQKERAMRLEKLKTRFQDFKVSLFMQLCHWSKQTKRVIYSKKK